MEAQKLFGKFKRDEEYLSILSADSEIAENIANCSEDFERKLIKQIQNVGNSAWIPFPCPTFGRKFILEGREWDEDVITNFAWKKKLRALGYTTSEKEGVYILNESLGVCKLLYALITDY